MDPTTCTICLATDWFYTIDDWTNGNVLNQVRIDLCSVMSATTGMTIGSTSQQLPFKLFLVDVLFGVDQYSTKERERYIALQERQCLFQNILYTDQLIKI